MPTKLILYILLLATGAAWGLSNPLMKIAVSTGYQPFGLIFWQLVVIVVTAGAVALWRNGRLPPLRRYFWHFAIVALLGTLLPDTLIYIAAAHVSAGVLSLLLAQVTMFALPMALLLGFERPDLLRLTGALCGAVAIGLLIGPEAALPEDSALIYILMVLGAAAFYAAQGNYITWRDIRDLDPVTLLFATSVVGLLAITPLALLSGQFVNPFVPWGAAEWAMLGTALTHALAYGGFFALVATSGPVFSSQVSYVVTGTGVLWSMLLLGERYNGWIWAAFVLMFIGIALLQPRPPKRHPA
ncbi:MAG: DMT family transporter [Rhodobacteraceae bacterium]|nr:DMT family transporter [Paracoccaceae bacterium]